MKLSDLLLFFFTFFVIYMLTKGVDAESLQLKEDGPKRVQLVLNADSLTISLQKETAEVAAVKKENASYSINSENFAIVGVAIVVAYNCLQKWLAEKSTSPKLDGNKDHISFKWNGATHILIKCEDETNLTGSILHHGRNTSFDSEMTETGESYV
ncbi:unnamed protein product [Caenorhabditis brenneri]